MSLYQRLLRHTNLDVGIGALLNCYVFALLFEVQLTWEIYALLFMVVWVIYTLDRIVDTYQVQEVMLSRHYFHRKYRKVLLIISCILALLSIFLLLQIPHRILYFGLLLSIMVLIYLLLAWKKIAIPKEIFIAIMYSSGVFLAPLSLLDQLSPFVLLLASQHMLLAFANLFIISCFEMDADRINGHHNIAHRIKHPWRVLLVLFITHCIISIFLAASFGWTIQIVFLLMWILFGLIMTNKNYFEQSDRYGMVADGAFLFPVIVLLIQ